ncbi:MAG: hypothetical protein V1760_01995, partial [Candidatus Peregrinibacteria bacterium]
MFDKHKTVTALSLTLSMVAIALSLYSAITTLNGKQVVADTNFDTLIEQGIENYIAKQNQPPEARRIAEKVINDIEDDDAVKG